MTLLVLIVIVVVVEVVVVVVVAVVVNVTETSLETIAPLALYKCFTQLFSVTYKEFSYKESFLL